MESRVVDSVCYFCRFVLYLAEPEKYHFDKKFKENLELEISLEEYEERTLGVRLTNKNKDKNTKKRSSKKEKSARKGKRNALELDSGLELEEKSEKLFSITEPGIEDDDGDLLV